MSNIDVLKELVVQQARDIENLLAELSRMCARVPVADTAASVAGAVYGGGGSRTLRRRRWCQRQCTQKHLQHSNQFKFGGNHSTQFGSRNHGSHFSGGGSNNSHFSGPRNHFSGGGSFNQFGVGGSQQCSRSHGNQFG